MRTGYNWLPLEARFRANVPADRGPDECWPWAGTIDRGGYGILRIGGRRKAHATRVAWELHRGPIPDGLVVDHVCFNRSCVNPDHLRLLTPRANSRNLLRSPGIRPEEECINGHLMTAANTYTNPRGHGECRTCIRERQRRCKARKRSHA